MTKGKRIYLGMHHLVVYLNKALETDASILSNYNHVLSRQYVSSASSKPNLPECTLDTSSKIKVKNLKEYSQLSSTFESHLNSSCDPLPAWANWMALTKALKSSKIAIVELTEKLQFYIRELMQKEGKLGNHLIFVTFLNFKIQIFSCLKNLNINQIQISLIQTINHINKKAWYWLAALCAFYPA